MGVFARLFGRTKGDAPTTAARTGAPAEEKTADTLEVEPAAGSTGETEAPKDGAAEKPSGAAEGAPEAEQAEGAQAAAPEGVEIPRQQSSGDAADREAGEGARQ
ncbi:hypothetical protein CRV15_05175 [Streptomyces clavuligerus]|uniref:Gliding motility protein n=1 Tax=Streptomyces clavuligerus TaxID=1901 RepID=B5GYA0_STRCL|nr:hypothetical protein SSCG_04324 [Streptomyces clavuligerus]EFG09742.1 Hypothetical protein SCLAV_4670 [Streptomyces clavuligerus]MBY6302155.1 hypothetical protein [Streptomyces clavuligerus]QCS05058.1 hypothetical protein CRV15_05175 [Streptomyces clavuligerus]QPJ95572.1 hypothetical protein GE265_22740 [Streptomyces clavuligerus]